MNARLYRNARFLLGAHTLAQLPPDSGREVAFAGRSNAGKSSVINALAGNRRLARTSKTPGKTRLINFFALAGNTRLVDLPGYGFARLPAPQQRHWAKIMVGYLETRSSLRGLIIIMDARRPLTNPDRQILAWCQAAGLSAHAVLNKADKLSWSAATLTLQKVQRELAPQGTTVQLFSATGGDGLSALRGVLDNWFQDGV